MLKKKTKVILLLCSYFTVSGCTSNTGSQHSRPMNLSHKSKSFVKGANDGCSTAEGHYKKNHSAFNKNSEYNEGWWAGRRNCENNK